jgi:CubicO group peptidase (beta-lactamase class C family)
MPSGEGWDRASAWDGFTSFLNEVLAPHRTPSVSLAVARGGRMVHHHAHGLRDTEEMLPVTPDTVYGIGSITKSFTAVAIMQLQEQGKLSVHDPVVRWLPEYQTQDPEATRATTIHHFLTHTAGLPPLPSLQAALAPSMLADPDVDGEEIRKRLQGLEPIDTAEQLMAFIARTPFELLGPPGEKFSYSNDAFALLGAIVARASGQPYEAYVHQHILAPAGMSRSAFAVETVTAWPDVAMLYVERKEKGKRVVRRSPAWWTCPSMSAAGFLKSTARDMLRYLEIYRNGGVVDGTRILSAESVLAMTEPYVRANNPAMHYGYGLMITPDYHGVKLVEHGGNIKGTSAWVSVVPEMGLSCVVLTNLVSAPGSRIALGAVNMELGLPVATPREECADCPCPADRLLQYTGEYASGEGAHVTVLANQAGLVFALEDETFPGRCVGEDAFAVKVRGQESRVEFLRDASGGVWALAFGFRIIARAKEPAPATA